MASMPVVNIIYVTHVEKEASYIKVWGQTDRNVPIGIEKTLQQITPQFDSGECMPNCESLFVGAMFCAKFKDGSYYRARITNLNFLQQGLVEVFFIDFGNKEVVHYRTLRMMSMLPITLSTIPPQAREYMLANVTYPPTGWNPQTIEMITNDICYFEYQMISLLTFGPFTLIKLLRNNEDVALNLINRGLAGTITTQMQTMELQNYLSNLSMPISKPLMNPLQQPQHQQHLQQQCPNTPMFLTYKTMPLDPGTEHAVFVSYVTDGPCLFSVQLKKMEDTLKKLMTEINNINLLPLEDSPLPGTVCLARSGEDGYICRAVVTNMVDNQFKVFYVDFGNTEVLPYEEIFQIPLKYVIVKVMATRFALAGLEHSAVSLEMKCAFKKFVNDKLLYLTVKPTTMKAALILCDLVDEHKTNVLEIVKNAALVSYPEPIPLSRGVSQEVRVSYVCGCNKFFVQLVAKQEDLDSLMSNLQRQVTKFQPMPAEVLKTGAPCFALYACDGQWYRAEVLDPDPDQVRIRYVDYGNEEVVPLANLRKPSNSQLVALRPQAVECCLNGYQNMESDAARDLIFEEILAHNEFNMKVIEVQAGRAIVDMFDKAGCNVAYFLIEKLRNQQQNSTSTDDFVASKFSTPVKKERKPLRDQNNKWNGEESENWRQKSPRSQQSNNNFNNKQQKPNRNESNRSFNSDERPNFNHSRAGTDNRNESKFRDNFSRSFNAEERPNFNQSRVGTDNRNESKFRDNFNRSFSTEEGPNFNQSRSGTDNRNETKFRDNFKSHKPNHSRNSDIDSKRFGKNEYKRDGSEKSWSDTSEKNKSWGGRNDKSPSSVKSQQRGPKKQFRNSFEENVDYAASNEAFPFMELSGQQELVSITWFHNPLFFYCQLQKHKEEFRVMMEAIQNAYSKRKPGSASTGSPVVALFPEDNVLYRAIVLENNSPLYRVQYIDFGNVAMADKIWPIEKRFMELPSQAVHCALDGIKCKEQKWPPPDVFSPYFDKDTFTCTFVSKDSNKYFVELCTPEASINQQLLAAELVSPTSEDTFNLALLFGQQIRVLINSVFDLGQFSVLLEPNLAAQCRAHNLETASETHLDLLKSLINQTVIIYVDDVTEGALIVTIYDTNGQKHVILSPDEGAFDTVDPLCAMPVYQPQISGYVSHANEDSVCLQPEAHSGTISALLDRLFEHYNEASCSGPEAELESVYAVLSQDGNWYRGRVVKIVNEEEVEVIYIDYGNGERVKKAQLRELTPEFLEQHMLAVLVRVKENAIRYLDQTVCATVWYGETGWEGEVQPGESTAPIFDSPAIKFADAEVNSEILPPEGAPELQTKGVAVLLTHSDSPSDFYLQLLEDQSSIVSLQAMLQEQSASLPALETPTAGSLCAAVFTADQQWYRAQILDSDSDIITVRFVDYGNTDVLTNDNTMIKTLPIELITLAQFAKRCSLNARCPEAEWGPLAFDLFAGLTTAGPLSAEIVHQDEKTTYVNLYSSGEDVGQRMIQEGLAAKLELDSEASCTGFISHLSSPSEFYVQLENSVGDLEWTAEQLAGAEKFAEIQDLTPGALAAAVFPEDEMWYRARILSNTVAGLEVLFVDYGNSCTCSHLKELPEELVMLPPLAQKCSLLKPAGVLQWAPRAIDKFREISADGAAVFGVNKIKPGETTVVQLFLDGEDISTQLLPVLEPGRILEILALDKLYVLKAEDESRFKALQERICQVEKKELGAESAVGNLVLCRIGEQFCRAKIADKSESSCTLDLLDTGGKLERCLLEKLYELPADLAEIYVFCCRLDSLPGVQFTEESLEKLKEIAQKLDGVFDLEFASSNTLRLYLNGSDVRSELGGIKLSPINSVHSTPKKAVNKESSAAGEEILNEILNSVVVEESLILETATESDFVTAEGQGNAKTSLDEQDNLYETTKYSEKEHEAVIVTESQREIADSIPVQFEENIPSAASESILEETSQDSNQVPKETDSILAFKCEETLNFDKKEDSNIKEDSYIEEDDIKETDKNQDSDNKTETDKEEDSENKETDKKEESDINTEKDSENKETVDKEESDIKTVSDKKDSEFKIILDNKDSDIAETAIIQNSDIKTSSIQKENSGTIIASDSDVKVVSDDTEGIQNDAKEESRQICVDELNNIIDTVVPKVEAAHKTEVVKSAIENVIKNVEDTVTAKENRCELNGQVDEKVEN